VGTAGGGGQLASKEASTGGKDASEFCMYTLSIILLFYFLRTKNQSPNHVNASAG
jgi:hypothetical protein